VKVFFLLLVAVIAFLYLWAWRRLRGKKYVPKKVKPEMATKPAVYNVPESRMQARIRRDTERDLKEWLNERRK